MQAKYWILTIPHANFTPYLPPGTQYIRGQLESGTESNFLHWQLVVCFTTKRRLAFVRTTFGPHHAEPTKSRAAMDYVWKEDTRVAGTQFELGELPIVRSKHQDWERVRSLAQSGQLSSVPADIYVRCYNQLRRIATDHLEADPVVKRVQVYWGATGTGKSQRAWNEAGFTAYPKDPRSKFWDGYRGQECVVIDEFRGGIDIGHMLRWLDRYPCLVEVKGSSVALAATKIWITSNLNPRDWYPDIDEETRQALLRRLEITYFPNLI